MAFDHRKFLCFPSLLKLSFVKYKIRLMLIFAFLLTDILENAIWNVLAYPYYITCYWYFPYMAVFKALTDFILYILTSRILFAMNLLEILEISTLL